MIIISFVQNVAILLTLTVLYQVALRRWNMSDIRTRFISGIIFGIVGIVGMMTPFHFAPGIIFDGRSIVLSIAGLFGGPAVAAVAASVCGAYRLWLGGAGTLVGISVIMEAAAVGAVFHYLLRRDNRLMRPLPLWGFGLLVHIVMLLLMLALPGGAGVAVLKTITLPVLLIYPVASMLICMMFLESERQLATERALRESEARLKSISDNLPSAMIYQVVAKDDRTRKFTYVSDSVRQLYGASPGDVYTDPNLIYGRIHEDHISLLMEAEKEALKTLSTFRSEVRVREPSGGTRWSYFASTPTLLEDGSTCWDGIELVITERILMEQRAVKAAAEWSATFDAMTESICLLDTEGRVRRCNLAFARLLGAPYGEIIGRECCELVHGGQHFEGLCPIRRMSKSLKREEAELLVKGRWHSVLVEPMLYGEGRLAGAVHVMLDIHQRKKFEEAIVQTEQKYRNLFMNAQEGIYQTSPEGSLLMANPAMAGIYGYASPQEMMSSVTDVAGQLYVHPEDREEFRRRMETDGFIKDYEVLHRKRDGSPIWIVSSARAMLDKNGRLLCYEGTVTDISERKQAEDSLVEKHRELEAAYEELKRAQARVIQQEKMASIGQLAAGITHEINNPMSFITGNLGILDTYVRGMAEFVSAQDELACKYLPPEALQELQEIKRKKKIDYILGDVGSLIEQSMEGAERVKKIVADLKTFSRMEEDIRTLEDVNAGLESTINIVWNEIKYKADLVKEYGVLPLVCCNISQINQVFMNLLVNAVQSIEKWGTITVKSWSDESNIYVSVSDTGSGIPEADRVHIFDPFFTTKTAGKGTGLGLSISFDIVRKHGGEVLLESEVGKGTTFTVRLPVVSS